MIAEKKSKTFIKCSCCVNGRDFFSQMIVIISFLCVQMIDLGVILHKGSYLRSGWNVIDAFVVACNIAALLLELVHLFFIVRILTYLLMDGSGISP